MVLWKFDLVKRWKGDRITLDVKRGRVIQINFFFFFGQVPHIG